MKLTGALAMILAGGAIGFYYSGRELFRIRDLLEFKKAFLILTSEIEYLRTPLADACANIAKRTDDPAAGFLTEFAERLTAEAGAYPAWTDTIESHKDKTYLTDEDFGVLDGFGKTLGYLDAKMQLNAISYVTDYIDGAVTSLQTQSEKTKRMYRSLGLIGGILAAVVLW